MAYINRNISEVNGKNKLSNRTAQKWVETSQDGHMNVHHEERSGRLSVITDGLVYKVYQNLRENRRFGFGHYLLSFHNVTMFFV